MTTTVEQALAHARRGEVDEALAILRREEREGRADERLLTLLFALLSARERNGEALEVAGVALARVTAPVARSTWALRRGLLHLAAKARAEALADLQLVLTLRANEGHQEQARKALSLVAALPKPARPRRGS